MWPGLLAGAVTAERGALLRGARPSLRHVPPATPGACSSGWMRQLWWQRQQGGVLVVREGLGRGLRGGVGREVVLQEEAPSRWCGWGLGALRRAQGWRGPKGAGLRGQA